MTQNLYEIRFPDMFTREKVKVELKLKGWTYCEAGEALGRTYQHISYVLNGQRESMRLLRELSALPARRAS